MNYQIMPGLKDRPVIRNDVGAVADIIKTVSEYFGENPLVKSRRREIVDCRRFCILFMKQRTKMTLKQIGDKFNLDHTSVIHSLNVVSDLMVTDPLFRRSYSDLNSLI